MMRITRRKILLSAAGAALALSVGGAYAQDNPTIALVQINQQALFFTQMNVGAQKAADAIKCQVRLPGSLQRSNRSSPRCGSRRCMPPHSRFGINAKRSN